MNPDKPTEESSIPSNPPRDGAQNGDGNVHQNTPEENTPEGGDLPGGGTKPTREEEAAAKEDSAAEADSNDA